MKPFTDEDMSILKDEIDKLDQGMLTELLPDLLARLEAADKALDAADYILTWFRRSGNTLVNDQWEKEWDRLFSEARKAAGKE